MINYEELSSSIETEKSVYACLLLQSKLSKDIVELTKEADYYKKEHKILFRAVNRLYLKNKVVDYATLSNELKRTKDIDKVGEDYLIDLSTSIVRVENFKAYMDIIVEKAEERRVQEKFLIFERDKDKYTFEERIEWLIENLNDTRSVVNVEFTTMKEELDSYVDYLEDSDTSDRKETLFQSLDSKLVIVDTDLITLAGRPGSGKSAYALNIANNWCKQGYKVTYISLEMSKNSLRNRLFSNLTNIENRDLKNKNITKDGWKKLRSSVNYVKENYNLNIYDKSITVEHLVNYCKVLKKNDNLDVLIVDHMLLMDTDKKINNRAQQVNYVTWKLKQLAMELKIPVLALTQLGRGNEKENRKPNKADLKESGGIEENSNAIILLHNKNAQNNGIEDFVDVIIEKNRDGEVGTITTSFVKPYQRFVEKGFDKELGRYCEIPLKEPNDIKKVIPKIQEKIQVKEYLESELPF